MNLTSAETPYSTLLVSQDSPVDSIHIRFNGHTYSVDGLYTADLDVSTDQSGVVIHYKFRPNSVLVLSGSCEDKSLTLISDTTCMVVFSNLVVRASQSPAFHVYSDHEIEIVLEDKSINELRDQNQLQELYSFPKAVGCFLSRGNVSFSGTGQLNVSSNYKHAIASRDLKLTSCSLNILSSQGDGLHSKNDIVIDGANISVTGHQQDAFDADKNVILYDGNIIIDQQSDNTSAVKCDNFTAFNGQIKMDLTGAAVKGIKAKHSISISGGNILSTIQGNILEKEENLSFCVGLRSDSIMSIEGGNISISNFSLGGRCLSSGSVISINDGHLELKTSSNGAKYTDAVGMYEFITSKCIIASDSLFLNGGSINCIAEGSGSKGVVSGDYLSIGRNDTQDSSSEPSVLIETKGESIVNDTKQDKRYGCPKGIKSDVSMDIFSGNVLVKTDGMGGEGIECNGTLKIYGGELQMLTFDDGINVGDSLIIYDGLVFCNSRRNDGIDSNGSIHIYGGIVASLNHRRPNESLDSENHQLHINGGLVLGIGSNAVKLGESRNLMYNTLKTTDPELGPCKGLPVQYEKYIYIMEGNHLLWALKNEVEDLFSFVTVSWDGFKPTGKYSLYLGDLPRRCKHSYFDNSLVIGGKPVNANKILDFAPLNSNDYPKQ